MAANMGSTEFVLQDTAIAHEVEGARVSINVVSENTPPSVPNHNADVIYAWCYSFMYDHETESRCFYIAKSVNAMLSTCNKVSDSTLLEMCGTVYEL